MAAVTTFWTLLLIRCAARSSATHGQEVPNNLVTAVQYRTVPKEPLKMKLGRVDQAVRAFRADLTWPLG
jgi:hypothetical protein